MSSSLRWEEGDEDDDDVAKYPPLDVASSADDYTLTSTHSLRSQRELSRKRRTVEAAPPPLCNCTPPRASVLRFSTKPNANHGRGFYSCVKRGAGTRCNFFQWSEVTPHDPYENALSEVDVISEPPKRRRTADELFEARRDYFACQQPQLRPDYVGAQQQEAASTTATLTASTAAPPVTSEPMPTTSTTTTTTATSTTTTTRAMPYSSAPIKKKNAKSRTAETGPNALLIKELERLKDVHERRNEKMHVLGYTKALNALRSYPTAIRSGDEAHAIKGIGERLANKIDEILRTGSLSRHVAAQADEAAVLDRFFKVHGVGPTHANRWYNAGARTLEQVLERSAELGVTAQQRIGIERFDDLQQRIPRDEVEAIARIVIDAAHALMPSAGRAQLDATVCGSYRRGASSCGDIDVLLSHAEPAMLETLMERLLARLHELGVITDDLTHGDGKSYNGVCRWPALGAKAVHRRLDIFIVPPDELAFALIALTGDDYFNRSMRSYAKTKGYSLSHQALTPVSRIGTGADKQRIPIGPPVRCATERDIFRFLGLQYVAPEHRNPGALNRQIGKQHKPAFDQGVDSSEDDDENKAS